MKILLCSRNAHKIEEIRAILQRDVGENIELISLDDLHFTEEIEETGATFEENALIKARAGAKTGYICIADDSGLEVNALCGAPGVHSARYAGEPSDSDKNNEKLLEELSGVQTDKRGARFVSVIAAVFPLERAEFTVRGECEGRILEEFRGKAGFGYDPLFLYEPLNKTFAQLTPEEKNRVSHRARSMKSFTEALKNKLKEYGYTLC